MAILTPLPRKAFEELVSPWLKVAAKGESASIVNLSQRSQLYRVNQLLKEKSLLKKYLGNKNQYKLIVLNLMSLSIDRPQELDHYLKNRLTKNGRIIIFVIDADNLIEEKKELLGFINTMPYYYQSLSILFFFKKNILLARILRQLSKYSILYKNVLLIPLYSKETILHFINYKASEFHIRLTKNLTQKIATQCGGRMWLVKQALRYFVDTQDQKRIFSHEGMNFRVRSIYNEFEPEEKEVLKKIVNRVSIYSKEEKEIIQYFYKIHFLQSSRNRLRLSIPLLEHYIQSELMGRFNFDLNRNNEIRINNVTVQGILSKGQKRSLSYLIRNPNQIISRDQTAILLGLTEKDSQYSDWALDMAINRLRQKLVALGLSRGLIVTVRNRGFIFKNKYV